MLTRDCVSNHSQLWKSTSQIIGVLIFPLRLSKRDISGSGPTQVTRERPTSGKLSRR